MAYDLENLRALGRAVVIRAILDYQDAKNTLKTLALTEENMEKIAECEETIAECADFLKSEYCRDFSGLNGKAILEGIDGIVIPSNPVEVESLIWTAPRRHAKGAS